MDPCPHHTLPDAVFAHPYFALSVALLGWFALCAAVVLTAHAFSDLVRRHTRH